ncbi:MAG: hypothetical protein AB7J30_12055 [Hyphomicrobium sp.]|uniref:hypothetical protein n=1 Tax=Hyphomicrobium sp. TaxID=82 RepID=UPI003D0EAB83
MSSPLPVIAAAVAALGFGVAYAESTTAPALTEDECRAIWNTAAGRAELSADGAKPYIDNFESVDTNRDRKVSNAEFRAGCKAGLVHKLHRVE